MGVYKLSAAGSITNPRTEYKSMLAGYGDFGAVQRIFNLTRTTTGSTVISNIPQTFKHLFLVVNARTDSSTLTSALLRFNGDSGNNYSSTLSIGNGTSATGERYTNESFFRIGYAIGSSQLASAYSTQFVYLYDYANSLYNKTFTARDASDTNGSGITQMSVGLWRNTSSINSITYATSLVAGSTLSLYGIKGNAL